MTAAASGNRRLGPAQKERALWAVALPWAPCSPAAWPGCLGLPLESEFTAVGRHCPCAQVTPVYLCHVLRRVRPSECLCPALTGSLLSLGLWRHRPPVLCLSFLLCKLEPGAGGV